MHVTVTSLRYQTLPGCQGRDGSERDFLWCPTRIAKHFLKQGLRELVEVLELGTALSLNLISTIKNLCDTALLMEGR